MRKKIIFLGLVFMLACHLFAGTFSPEKANFSIKIKEFNIPYRVMSIFALPNEHITIEFNANKKSQTFNSKINFQDAKKINSQNWELVAPEATGMYTANIIRLDNPDSMKLNIFVMVPFNQLKDGYLNGYRIGNYPTLNLNDLVIYTPPRGFVEVTKENEDVLLSPHFKLWQFRSIQKSNYPKYVVIRTKLLLKLELILEKTNEKGYACQVFHIMSGYRTPYYNELIGNVKYSRHVYGGAVDIFIDENPVDNMMDDLNQDGENNWKDANILYEIIDNMYGQKFYEPLVGGLGLYKKNVSHGPFVHVDVRGFRARWGY